MSSSREILFLQKELMKYFPSSFAAHLCAYRRANSMLCSLSLGCVLVSSAFFSSRVADARSSPSKTPRIRIESICPTSGQPLMRVGKKGKFLEYSLFVDSLNARLRKATQRRRKKEIRDTLAAAKKYLPKATKKCQSTLLPETTQTPVTPSAPVLAGGVRKGFYGYWTVDVTGFCGGLCWTTYYFIDNETLYIGSPPNGVDRRLCQGTDTLSPDGTKDGCTKYSISNGTITIGSQPPQSFSADDSKIIIDGTEHPRFGPLRKDGLVGSYRSFSYSSLFPGSGVAIERYITFNDNGTFTQTGFVGTSSDGSEIGGNGTGVSTTTSSNSANSGRFTLEGNTLTRTYENGEVETDTVFAPDESTSVAPPSGPITIIRLGERDYTLQ
jgi:hypothetical protein